MAMILSRKGSDNTSNKLMRPPKKAVFISQYYSPDSSTTSEIVSTIAEHAAKHVPVLVISGTPQSASAGGSGRPTVVEVAKIGKNKEALLRRAFSEGVFALRVFWQLIRTLRSGDAVITVTAPFMLPYATTAAAKFKRARSALILHDLFPDALIMTGLTKSTSLLARTLRVMNGLVFRALDAIVVIGRDAFPILLGYRGVSRCKIHFIPNWATLHPDVRPVPLDSHYRGPDKNCFVVGLSGNLGFTHDPEIVFEAARLLREDTRIAFVLSGWGVGFKRLRAMQAEDQLPNVTLIDRVPKEDLETFLTAADAWIIPYRAGVAGVSVPSRLYNLLAVGRPVILVSEPTAEASLLIQEHEVGWVVEPGDASALAAAIQSAAAGAMTSGIQARAVDAARQYTTEPALERYRILIENLLETKPDGDCRVR